MAKILVYSVGDFGNRGLMAILMGLIKCLRSYMPGVDITVFSRQPSRYRKIEKLGVKISQDPWTRESSRRMLNLARYPILISLDFFRCLLWRFAGRFKKSITYDY